MVDPAGQLRTVGPQLIIVLTLVEKIVEVVDGGETGPVVVVEVDVDEVLLGAADEGVEVVDVVELVVEPPADVGLEVVVLVVELAAGVGPEVVVLVVELAAGVGVVSDVVDEVVVVGAAIGVVVVVGGGGGGGGATGLEGGADTEVWVARPLQSNWMLLMPREQGLLAVSGSLNCTWVAPPH